MKTKTQFFALAFALLLISLSSCTKDDSLTNTEVTSKITSGEWQISSFHEPGEDHTSQFNGYVFTFGSTGELTGTISGTTTTGSWFFDDNGTEFHLEIGNSEPLSKISKGWIILESTSTILRLGDDSGNSEELDFAKI